RKPLRDAVAAAEKRIADALEDQRRLHGELASAARADDGARIAALSRQLAEAEREEAAAEGDWLAASEAFESAGHG
ncbi:MAG: ABC transporter ATP-binding protein, partial [Defluviicoccus sp.]|nr:ABC transporter ATP-binding protein [Defluviicoccus sp.]